MDGYSAEDVATFYAAQTSATTTIPGIPLKKLKVPTDTVQLNIFESRYRTMFRLIKKSRSRVFGVTLREANGRHCCYRERSHAPTPSLALVCS